ncbi:MAG: tetratricopeptide repeat protein [Rhodothermales bacterium]
MERNENWVNVERIFTAALDLDGPERAAFLKSECNNDYDLLRRVENLLAAHAATGVVDRLQSEISRPLMSAFSRSPSEGQRVGPYLIRSLLGRGGMGNVYLAERSDGQFEQQVALKLIREGINSESVRARFRLERQLLAKLQHPNITRLLDGGIDDNGRPYFAMEVVEGERLDDYADKLKLTVEKRLALFTQVCDAVQYAHSNLVVHRDLKPGNILVREVDGAPRVLLMDFGIATLLEGDTSASGSGTITRAMTPEYASPEQIRGDPVTTRTDVYSLGVILYELLSGFRPYDVRGLSPADVERTICESVPQSPSTAVLTGTSQVERDKEVTSASERRGTVPDSLARRLEGDLDTIVMKALAKEPERRYASAEAFLADIKRHLAGLPVEARPDTIRYRVSKFARRHKFGVAAATLICIAIAGGIGGVVWQANRAAHERDKAIVEARKAEASLSLLIDMFEQADPGANAGRDLTAREVLDSAAERVALMQNSSTIKPVLLDAIARVNGNLGLYENASTLFEQALAADSAANGGTLALPATLAHFGELRYREGRSDEADSLLQTAITLLRRDNPDRSRDLALALHVRAMSLRMMGRIDEAESAAEESLEMLRRDPRSDSIDVGAAVYVLATLQHDRGNYKEGERLFRRAIALYRTDSTRVDPNAADAAVSLGQYLQFSGKFDEAAEYLQEALEVREKLYGPRHPQTVMARGSLASLYFQIGRTADSEALLLQVLEAGSSNPDVPEAPIVDARHVLGMIRFGQERYAESAILLEGVVDSYRKMFGDDSAILVAVRNHLGRAYLRDGRPSDSRSTFERSEALARKLFGDDHPYVAEAIRGLAAVDREQRDFESARVRYNEALRILEKNMSPDNEGIALARQDLGSLLVQLGRAEDAQPMLEQSLEVLKQRYPPEHHFVLNGESYLAEALAANGEVAKAIPLARHASDGLERVFGHDHRQTIAARARQASVEKRSASK